MLETKEQKQIFFTTIVLIVLLVVVSVWHKPSRVNKNAPPSGQDVLSSKAYLDYVAAANVDKAASDQLFQTIITKEEIQKEVETKLQVKQKITAPSVDSKKIIIRGTGDGQAVNEYLTQSVSLAYSFSKNTKDLSNNIFSGDTDTVNQLKVKLQDLTNKLYATPVPKEAVDMHKSLLAAYLSYGDLLNSAVSFNAIDPTKNDAVWPDIYKNYSIANESTKKYTGELNKLAGKYNLSFIPVHFYAENEKTEHVGNMFIPEAQAFLGVGDTTFTFTLGDVPRLIMDGVKEGLKSAFLQFTGAMLNTLITKIEQNYVIANFLYYSDALVNGQYTDDYLKKYVGDQLDRTIIKKFIPQFTCGANQNLQPLLQAKANTFLGFNPQTLDVNDPDYYSKMAKVGDFFASPSGWQLYYDDLAQQTQSAAQKAAEQELTSSGLKTPRSTVQSAISASINNIMSAESGAFNALFNLGISNSDSVISNVVATLTQTLVNKFVFQGVTSNGGNIAVLKEQPTCVSAAVLTPVLAIPSGQYQSPPSAQTQQSVIAQQCSNLDSVGGDCTKAVLGELQVCAQNPAQHTGTQSCSSLAGSKYVNTLLGQCSRLVVKSSECANLQSLLSQVR